MAVAEKGIARRTKEENSEILQNLGRIFGHVESFNHNPWYLTLDDFSDEKTYRAVRPEAHPLTSAEVKKAKEAFEKANKILKIYELVEIG